MNAEQRRQAEEWAGLINGASIWPLEKTCACSLTVTEAKELAALLRAGIAASEELDLARVDVMAAAGELLVPIPAPGTDMARVMLANAAMRRERDAALESLRQRNVCCVCGSDLLPKYEDRPHCEDCVVPEDFEDGR